MSTLKTNTLTGTTSAGSIVVTGEGGSTTTNLQQGLAKAWVNLTQSDASVIDSLNVSSGTDRGTGASTTTFTNAMGNATYIFVSSGEEVGETNRPHIRTKLNGKATGSCQTDNTNDSGTAFDCILEAALLGDLA